MKSLTQPLINVYLDDTLYSHHDLHIQLSSWKCVCDSYYLQLDKAYPEHIPQKGLKVLKLLITQWNELVHEMKEGEAVLLPFEFADEFIVCFKVNFRQDQMDFSVVSTRDIAGFAVHPSDILAFSRSNPALAPVNKEFEYSVTISKEQTLLELQNLISRISDKINK